MKKKNSCSEFTAERNEMLFNNFRRAIAAQSKIALKEAFHTAAEAPAPRFWVSENRAAAIIGKMLSGNDPTESMYEEKKEMYRELFARFLALRDARPRESISSLIFEVVNQPAPKAYISWERARNIIYQTKRLNRQKNGI